jgi:hypothetical protein
MVLRDHFAAAIAFAFGATVFIVSGNFPPAAALFPRAVAVIMMIAAAVIGVRATILTMPRTEPSFDRDATFRIGVVIALTIAYVFSVAWLGYVTASLVFIPLTAWFLGIRRPLLLAATTVIFVGVMAYLFRQVFSIPLPREAILGLVG